MEITGNAVEIYSQRNKSAAFNNHTPTMSGRLKHQQILQSYSNSFHQDLQYSSQRTQGHNLSSKI